MPTQAKINEVEELVRELTGARSVLLADFTGMDVAELSELRRRCRAERVRFRVARNTLSRRALQSMGMEAIETMLEGPTGIAVALGDELAAARVLVAFAKEKERPRLKGGLIEGKVFSLDELKTLASLPARKELLSQLLMVFEAPVSQLVSGISRLAGDLMSILDQLAERRAGESPAGGATAGMATAGEATAGEATVGAAPDGGAPAASPEATAAGGAEAAPA